MYILYQTVLVPQKSEIIANNLCNYKSVTYQYALNNHKEKNLQKMFQSDLAQLVHDYDKEIFSSNKLLNTICDDWEKNIKPYISQYIQDNNTTISISFNQKILENMNLLDINCIKTK